LQKKKKGKILSSNVKFLGVSHRISAAAEILNRYIHVGQNPDNQPDVSELGQMTRRRMNRAGRIGPDAK
jgi:hypothetical protein